MTATAHDLTLMALAETNPRAYAALAAAGPNRAGDPPVGALGFMAPDDCLDLCRAADLAHRALGHDLDTEHHWPWHEAGPDALARLIARDGSWRHLHDGEMRSPTRRALDAYREAVRAHLAAEGMAG